MIIKELEPFRGTDKFQIAGRQAEEQMAFYLRRYFGDSEDVYIINDLRLGRDGESLQIDHLVVHQNGLIIIESKSVSGKIIITNDLQWIRQYKDFSTGMKSPIIQTEMQKMLLASILEELKTEHRCKISNNNIDLLIAISDNGIIEWPSRGPIEGIYKADQICKKINFNLQNANTKNYKIVPENEIEKIKKDILDLKIINPQLSDYFDSEWQPRGNYPQWIAEFLCGCHFMHMVIQKNIVPKALKDNITADDLILLLKQLDEVDMRNSEIRVYAEIWRNTFGENAREFSALRNIAVRQDLHNRGLLKPPIRRAKKIP